MKTLNTNSEQRRKWWEIATSQDEVDLFTCIARNPKYAWRSIAGVTKELGWDKAKIDQVLKPFIHNRMVIAKQTKKGLQIAYWERIKESLEPKNNTDELSEDEKLEQLNKQIRMIQNQKSKTQSAP